MKSVFTVLYINVDEPKYSEVIGSYTLKDDAVNALIRSAHYKKKDGRLFQYIDLSSDFESYEMLVEQVNNSMELIDFDIYRIEETMVY